jgi:hypothetical protein
MFRSTLKIDLPETIFTSNDASYFSGTVFKSSDPTSELHELAFPNGVRRRLSKEQLAQLRKTGTFEVESSHKDIIHVWKVSALLVLGTANIVDIFRHSAGCDCDIAVDVEDSNRNHATAFCIDQVARQVAHRIWNDNLLSVRNGIESIGHGVRDIFSVLFGLIERVPARVSRILISFRTGRWS